jgi:hypothetical protein
MVNSKDERAQQTSTDNGHRLSDDAISKAMALMKDSDSVELKLTIPQGDQRRTIEALQIDPIKAQIRQVFFLDTPDLRLNAAGVVVRARRVQGRLADSVVKLRPVIPSEMPRELRRSPSFVIEVDAMRGGFVCSGSLKGETTNERVRQAAKHTLPVRKLFSKEQRAFYKEHAPEDLTLDDLTIWGPIFVLKTKWVPEGRVRPMVAEMWLYPDDSHVLELSTKCQPAEAFQVAAEARAYLSGRGVELAGPQATKTRKALDFFAKAA